MTQASGKPSSSLPDPHSDAPRRLRRAAEFQRVPQGFNRSADKEDFVRPVVLALRATGLALLFQRIVMAEPTFDHDRLSTAYVRWIPRIDRVSEDGIECDSKSAEKRSGWGRAHLGALTSNRKHESRRAVRFANGTINAPTWGSLAVDRRHGTVERLFDTPLGSLLSLTSRPISAS